MAPVHRYRQNPHGAPPIGSMVVVVVVVVQGGNVEVVVLVVLVVVGVPVQASWA